jgi:glucokinase
MSHDGHGAIPAPVERRPLLVGVDVGGTKITVLVTEAGGRVLARELAPVGAEPQHRAAERIAAVVRASLGRAGASPDDVQAVGVGVPGRVDPLAGSVSLAVNLGWSDLPLGPDLEALLGRPCVLENDVRAAAFGLHRRHVVGDIDDLAYLAIGTGVSAGVVLHGRLHRGTHGLAGEIGHVVVDSDGPECACGERGCLEALVSGPAIARLARSAIRDALVGDVATPLRDVADVTSVDVYRAAADGDRVALEVVDGVGRWLAWAVHVLVMTYDVERIVLGGGVSHAGATFLEPIVRELGRLREGSDLAREQLRPGVLELLPPDADAGAWGAVTIAGFGRPEAAAGGRRREVGHAWET